MIEIAESYQEFKSIESRLLAEGFKYYTAEGRKMIYKKVVSGIVVTYKIHMQFWIHD